MIVTIHQPDFLPWLGFFDRWRKSDLYIVLDDVQFIRQGWHHRDKIKTQQGIKWLTVPVVKKGRYSQQIRDVEIDNSANWQKAVLNTIRHAYSKAPYFEPVFKALQEIFLKNHRLLIDLNLDLLSYCAKKLQINTPIQYASSSGVTSSGTDRLVELVKAVGGTVYLTGQGSKEYLREDLFSKAGIKVHWQMYQQPEYPQLHGPFEKMLSVLDFLVMVPEPAKFTE